MNDWIQIFRTGRHTDSEGKERIWTEADLDRIVAKYDSRMHEAPVVIGHPKENAPAYGWVEALKCEEGVLYAKLKNLVPEFLDMVKRGLFKKRSVSLYPNLILRHIGFLGAMPPAIKGLEDIRFQERDQITISFSDFRDNINFGEGGAEMSKSRKNELERELERKINDFLRNPPSYDRYGNKVPDAPTYSQAFEYVQMENPELSREYTEIIRATGQERFRSFSEAAGKRIVALVEEKMRIDKALTYSEALIKVQFENPQLIREYLNPE